MRKRQEFRTESVVGKMLKRAITIDKRELNVDEESRTVDLAFSSDAPIRHWWGRLILDHSSQSVDLTRLAENGALLWSHRWDEQIGAVEEVVIGSDNKGRAKVKFSRSAQGEENFQDVKDGIKRSVSVGFICNTIERELDADGNHVIIDDEYVYRSRSWEPIEISLVAVPADTSVGVGRSLLKRDDGESESCPDCSAGLCPECGMCPDCETCSCDTERSLNDTAADARGISKTKTENIKTMDEKEKKQEPVVVGARSEEVARIAEFTSIGELFGERSLGQEFALTDGKTIADLKRAILEKRQSSQPKVDPRSPVELNEQETKRYSIGRAILAEANIRDGKKESCFELEVSDEIRRKIDAPGAEMRGGILIPTNLQITRAGLDSKTSTAGQKLVYTEFGGTLIELLRNKMKVAILGATMLPGLQGNVAFPRQATGGSGSWVGENPGSDVAEGDATIDNVTLSPKTYQATTSYSRQLLAQSVLNVDDFVTNDLIQINALAIDKAAIHGSGSSNQPTGIYAQSGVNAVAFGGTITFAKVVDMETAVADSNADVETMGYLSTSTVRGKAKQTAVLANTISEALWKGTEMNGYRAEISNQVSKVMLASAETGGTSHGIILGNWAEMLIGEWGAMEIITDPYRLKKQGMIEVTTFTLVDIQLRHGASFCKGTGLVP